MPHRHNNSARRHCRHQHCLAKSPSRESINIIVENDAGVCRDRSVIREPAVVSEATVSTEDDAEIVREILPRPRSRCKIIIDESDDHRPRPRRSLSGIRYVRSRSPHHAHFIDELDNTRNLRRRSSSVSRVSFADEQDEVIVSRPRSRSRHRRIYYDGADSGQSEVKNALPASKNLATLEDGPQEHGMVYKDPSTSIRLRPVSESSRVPVSFHNQQSSSRPGRAYNSYASNQTFGHLKSMHPTASYSCLRPMSAQRFVDDDLGHFRDGSRWNRPKTDTACEMSSAKDSKYSRDRTTEYFEHPPKRRRYREPSSHAGSESKGSCAPLHELDYRPVSARLLEVPRPTTTHHKNIRPPTPLTPDHPDHPDHLAYLLSAQHITPVETAPGEWEYYQNRNSPLSADYSPPATPTDSLGSYYHNLYREGDGLGYTRNQLKTLSEMDYDEAEYYEAKGREYMEQLAAEKVEREHLEYAYA